MPDHPSYSARPGYFDPGGAAHMHASLRASDTDREQLVDVLKAAFGEGRLDQDEYTSRMEQAYTARTYGELRARATHPQQQAALDQAITTLRTWKV